MCRSNEDTPSCEVLDRSYEHFDLCGIGRLFMDIWEISMHPHEENGRSFVIMSDGYSD